MTNNIKAEFNHSDEIMWVACGLDPKDKEFIDTRVAKIGAQMMSKQGYKNSMGVEDVILSVKKYYGIQDTSIWRDEVLLALSMFVLGQTLQKIEEDVDKAAGMVSQFLTDFEDFLKTRKP